MAVEASVELVKVVALLAVGLPAEVPECGMARKKRRFSFLPAAPAAGIGVLKAARVDELD